MTNHHTKLEDPWAMSSLVIDRTGLYTDRPTDQHVQSNIPPLLRKGGIIRICHARAYKMDGDSNQENMLVYE